MAPDQREGSSSACATGFVIARIKPEPSLTSLPSPAWLWRGGPEPAPTEGDRYFGYGPRVYDAAEDRWTGPSDTDWGPFGWGGSHRERWFSSSYWGEGNPAWLLLPPKIEHPPFDDRLAFRIARPGDCLPLRDGPGDEGTVTDCLPNGERLMPADPPEPLRPTAGAFAGPYDWRRFHPSLAFDTSGESPTTWVYVRTESGAEGWVSHDYLEHD